LSSDSKLEQTVDKILNRTQNEILEGLQKTHEESQQKLTNSNNALEQEYDRILDEAKKESEKMEKQIVGSSDLESRNKQLLLVEESVKKVFDNAIEKIRKTDRNEAYSNLINTLLKESTDALGTSEVIVSTNSADKNVVKSNLSKFSGAELSSDTIECLGGVEVKSKDGTMTFNNTIDAKLERMNPLIRKQIATKFGVGV